MRIMRILSEMFNKKEKKLYKIVYRALGTIMPVTTIVEAKDEFDAFNKFYKLCKPDSVDIHSVEEYKV